MLWIVSETICFSISMKIPIPIVRLEKYRQAITEHFGSRIWFMGLQGSYGRGEASPESDIDVVLILDQAGTQDFLEYREILDTLPERDRICGFVSGKDEIEAWEPSDLFQFYYDTTPIMGSLEQDWT